MTAGLAIGCLTFCILRNQAGRVKNFGIFIVQRIKYVGSHTNTLDSVSIAGMKVILSQEESGTRHGSL